MTAIRETDPLDLPKSSAPIIDRVTCRALAMGVHSRFDKLIVREWSL